MLKFSVITKRKETQCQVKRKKCNEKPYSALSKEENKGGKNEPRKGETHFYLKTR